ncbi:MAG: glycosyltransferase family 4 protein, partial [Myxococcota bacterium]
MKPLHILHLLAYPLYSGPVAPTLGLARQQAKDGHRVSIACDTKRGNFDGYEEAALPRLSASGLHADLGLCLSTKSTPIELMRDVARLRATLKGGEVDVVHVHMSHDHSLALVARQGLKRGPTVIRTFHAARSLEERLGQSFLNRSADGWIVRNTDDYERAIQSFSLPEERMALVPGSIDPEMFVAVSSEERTRAKRELGLPEDHRVVGHVALIAERGQEELLDALQMIAQSDLHLLFVGKGEAESALRQRVSESGLEERVHFSGYLRDAALLRAYGAMDAAFVAGPGNDSSVRAVLEAMSSGLPVIGVAVGAVKDVVDESRGYLVESRTPAAIAEGLRAFMSDPQPEERGRAGRSLIERERR